MSLKLDGGTKPKGLFIKTSGLNDTIILGDYRISMLDFLLAARYVLTNTDLEPNDPRLKFIEVIKKMRVVEGWDSAKKRLE
jgi:hypothetical protein